MQKIQLDKEFSPGQQEENPNELLDTIQKQNQEAFDRVQKEGFQINLAMAQELLAHIRDIDGPIYDYAGGHRYINLETEPIPYSLLRRAGDTEPGRLIKNKRRLDFAQWGVAPAGGKKRGAIFKFSNPDFQPTKEEKTLLSLWQERLLASFFYPPNDTSPNFAKFIGAAYEDYFDLDDITLEIRTDGFDNPVAIHLQDPVLFKPVVKKQRYTNHIIGSDTQELIDELESIVGKGIKEEGPIEPDYLLVYQNIKLAGVTRDKVMKSHFFLRSDHKWANRGYSIAEQAVRMITYITNALKMNASNFMNSRLPLGLFAFTGGGVSPLALENLKKTMYAYQNGSANQNRIPMISLNTEKGDLKWVSARGNSRDMEYHQFMTLLFSIFCQLSGTDPREVTLGSYGDAVGAKSLFQESTDGVVKESKDLGAKVFLQYLADSLNSPNKDGANIFKRVTGLDIMLSFEGFEIEDRKAKVEINSKLLTTTKSFNDLLAEEDKEKQELMLGDINVYDLPGFTNQQIYQTVLFNAQQKAQQEQMQQQMQPSGPAPQQGNEQGEQNGGQLTDKDKELLRLYGNDADMEGDLRSEYEKLSKTNKEE